MLRSSLFAVLLLALSGAVAFDSPAARISAAPLPASQTLRVMTYKLHVGVGIDKKLDLARIAGVINAQHPDLVGLQEVDRGVTRTQRIDEIAELAKLTRMDYGFAFNLRYQQVSTGSDSDGVPEPSTPQGRGPTRSLPLPVLTSSWCPQERPRLKSVL